MALQLSLTLPSGLAAPTAYVKPTTINTSPHFKQATLAIKTWASKERRLAGDPTIKDDDLLSLTDEEYTTLTTALDALQKAVYAVLKARDAYKDAADV